jgi:hypothetical protein
MHDSGNDVIKWLGNDRTFGQVQFGFSGEMPSVLTDNKKHPHFFIYFTTFCIHCILFQLCSNGLIKNQHSS